MPDTLTRILVIKLGALGDFIQALGAMAAIRGHHPDAHITLLTTAPFKHLGERSPYFDEVLIDAKPRWYDPAGWLRLRRALNAGRFDRVYDLQNNDRTGLYFKLLSPRPEWVGIAAGASHRNMSPSRTAGRAFDGHRETLQLAGIKDVRPDDLSWMTADVSRFALKKPYVLFIPGGSAHRPAKRWPATQYREAAEGLGGRGYQLVLIGAAAERDVIADIGAGPSLLDLSGQTDLYDLAALARGAAGAIGNDTGPSHLIAMTGCPTVMLYCRSESTIKRHGPLVDTAVALEADDLQQVTAQQVLEAISPQLRP